MSDPCLLSEQFIFQMSGFCLLTFNKTFQLFNFNAHFVQPLLVLNVFLVEYSVIMLEVFILFALECSLLFELLDSFL